MMDIYNKVPMRILSYLTLRPDKNKCTVSEIARVLEVSKGSVSQTLNGYSTLGLIRKEKIGSSIIHEIDINNPVCNQFRIFENLYSLQQLVELLKDKTRRIILFGSCATGTDTIKSDIDLFVLLDDENRDEVEKMIKEYPNLREINPIIVDELELIDLETDDEVFYKEINKGIELWGGNI